MIARNVSETQIQEAAKQIGVEIRRLRKCGKGWRFTLGLAPTKKYQRMNSTFTRKVNAVDWFGYRDFFMALYAMNQSAVFITTMARYNNFEDFLEKYIDTAYKNVGSRMYPCYYMDASVEGGSLYVKVS